MTEQGAVEAAKHMAEYDKKHGLFDDKPCMGCDSEESQRAYREAYRNANPRIEPQGASFGM